jgi:hypothetical protein
MGMGELTPAEITGLLADGDRLRVVAALVLGASTVDEVCTVAGLDARGAGTALARLAAAGLVEHDVHGYRVVEESIRAAARSAGSRRADSGIDTELVSPNVLRAFVRDGRIVRFPTARPKMRQLLDLVAQDFEPGRRYSEKQVNEVLASWHPDVATLRRSLVDEGFMSRHGGGGRYWRSGGAVDPEPG